MRRQYFLRYIRNFNAQEILFFGFFGGENVHSALNALFHHSAGRLVGFVDIALEMIVVRRATAAANKFGETVAAFFAREKTGRRELIPDFAVEFTRIDVAHKEIFIAYELVAGINIAVGGDGEILVARAAGGNLLLQAHSALEVDIEMEEIETFALFVLFKVLVAEVFVLA